MPKDCKEGVYELESSRSPFADAAEDGVQRDAVLGQPYKMISPFVDIAEEMTNQDH